MSAPNKVELSLLLKNGQVVLFNYAGTGEQWRNQKNWLRVWELQIDGMPTDCALESAKLYQANPI